MRTLRLVLLCTVLAAGLILAVVIAGNLLGEDLIERDPPRQRPAPTPTTTDLSERADELRERSDAVREEAESTFGEYAGLTEFVQAPRAGR